MASTAAERKAKETALKAEQGLKRRSFWLNENSIAIIEQYSKDNNCNKDESLNQLLQLSLIKQTQQ